MRIGDNWCREKVKVPNTIFLEFGDYDPFSVGGFSLESNTSEEFL